MDMLSILLTGGQSSRLHRQLVDQDKLAMTIQAIPLGLEDPGLKIIFGLPNMGVEMKALEQGLEVQLAKVRTDLISEREFQKLRNQVESTLVNSNNTIASRATTLANNHLLHGNAGRINTALDRYMEVTREDIRRVAQEYLKKEYRVVLYYLPKQQ